jgi:hypothetical protein
MRWNGVVMNHTANCLGSACLHLDSALKLSKDGAQSVVTESPRTVRRYGWKTHNSSKAVYASLFRLNREGGEPDQVGLSKRDTLNSAVEDAPPPFLPVRKS